MNDNKRPLGFVNRRGHNADITAVDLDGLSIDNQPETMTRDEFQELLNQQAKSKDKVKGKDAKPPKITLNKSLPPPVQKPLKKLGVRRHAKWTRKKTVSLVMIILVLGAIPVAGGEVLRGQYNASTSAAQDSLKTIVKNDVLPQQKKSDITSQQLSAVTDKLEDVRDGMCAGGLLDNMAMLYPRSRAAHTTCIEQRERIASLVTRLRDMEKMLRYLELVDAALVPVTVPTTDAFAVIATQQTTWQKVSKTIDDLNPPASLAPAHTQLLTAATAITAGWSKLNVANNEQNAANFRAAEAQLNEGYAAVRASKVTFEAAVTAQQTAISTQSTKLY